MKLFFPLILLLVWLLHGCQTSPQAVQDLQAIKKMFGEFQKALAMREGPQTAGLVSTNSIERFEQFRTWALTRPADVLKSQPLVEQIETLRLRHFFQAEQLASANGREVIAMLVDQGELPTPFVQEAVLTEPVFKNDRCYIQIFDRAGPAKEKLSFVKEDDEWKIDIASMEFVQEKIYQRMIRKHDLTLSEFIEKIVSTWDGDVNLDQLWLPLQKTSNTELSTTT